MTVKNIIYGFFYWGTIFGFLTNLTSCVPINTNNPEGNVENELAVGTLEVSILPTSMPRPQFIRAVSPVESINIPLQLYKSISSETWVENYPIGFPNPQQGYNSQICMELNFAPPVAQQEDSLITRTDVLSRLNLQVDDQNRTLAYDILFKYGFEKEITVSEDGLTQWVSPWTFCWEAELEVGIHEVEFQFHQTSGDILSYTWYFQLTE